MPLMVDPSSGLVLQNNDGNSDAAPVTTFHDLSATPTATELVSAASAMSLGRGSLTSGSSAAATASGQTQQEQSAAEQMAMNSSTPRNLLFALMGILLLIMVISHPRFLARWFATRSYKPPPKSSLLEKGGQQPRRAGGGDLEKGWTLRSGKKTVSDDGSSWLASSDPFKDPVWMPRFPDQHRHSFIGPTPSTTPAPTLTPPPHMSPLLSGLPFASALLMAPFARLPFHLGTSLKIPQIAVIVVYLAFIGLAMIWKSDVNPVDGYAEDFMRTGWVAMSQIPIVIGLGVRANLFGLCVGKGYERLKVFHKIVGRVVFLSSTLHVSFYLWKITFSSQHLRLDQSAIRAGFAAWIAVLLLGVTALPWIRQRMYTVFKLCHFAGMLMLLIGLALHVQVSRPWCLASAVTYCISHLFSACKTRFATAELTALSNDSTLVSIPSLCTGWRAGQHVRLRIPGVGLSAHPFTIASAPDGEGMVLLCRISGAWTRKLHSYAWDPNTEQNTRKTTVILEGPYGGLGNTLLPSFSAVLLVAGGSGITQALSLAHDLVIRAPSGVVRARTIELLWIVKKEEMASPLFPTLVDLVKDARTYEEKCLSSRQNPSPVALRVKIYLSRCPSSSPVPLLEVPPEPPRSRNPFISDSEKAALARAVTCSRKALSSITVERGRPFFPHTLDGLADEVLERGARKKVDPCGICVTACGPRGLVNDVRDAVRVVEGWKKRGVGGIELEEEQFGF